MEPQSGRGSAEGSYDSQRLSTSSDKGSTGGSIGENEAHVSKILKHQKKKNTTENKNEVLYTS